MIIWKAIIDQLGLTDEFFPEEGDPQVTEDAYEKVLDVYRGKQKLNDIIPRDAEDVCHDIVDCLKSTRGVRNAYYEDSIEAIRFTLSDGYEYQLVLQTLDM